MKKLKRIAEYIIIAILMIINIAIIVLKINQTPQIEPEIEIDFVIDEVDFVDLNQITLQDSVKLFINEINLQHGHIAYAQFALESGYFTSFLFKKNNNCAGMRLATNRVTLAKGERYGYAYYDSWQDCILDYAYWQMAYRKGLSEEEYLSKLSSYAEDPLYINTIKKLSKYE